MKHSAERKSRLPKRSSTWCMAAAGRRSCCSMDTRSPTSCGIEVAPILAERYTVVAPDLRGYGDSGKPEVGNDPETYSKRRTGQDQLEVMTALGHDFFHVVGHDRGGTGGPPHGAGMPRAGCRASRHWTWFLRRRHSRRWTAAWHFAWFHWHLMRQPEPLPETLVGSNAKFYLDFLLERWTAVEGAITEEAYAEYLRASPTRKR